MRTHTEVVLLWIVSIAQCDVDTPVFLAFGLSCTKLVGNGLMRS